MAKINKIYSAFYNGVSEQNAELVLDNQCREMTNCIPDLVRGIKKRPPAVLTEAKDLSVDTIYTNARVFHSYDRGEDNEEYIMVETGDSSEPLIIHNSQGEKMVVNYTGPKVGVNKAYLANGGLRGLTVQDRTWVYSKNVDTSLDYAGTSPLDANYDKVAYYWLKRGSGDRYNPYNYAVYLDGITFAVDPTKPDTTATNPPTGAEDSDVAAGILAGKINAHANFSCTKVGSILKITKNGNADFTFSSWDSWGNQASEGWKGSVNKITDLPKDMTHDNAYVAIVGTGEKKATTYYVKWNGSSWEECLDPKADRGQLANMPLQLNRVSLSGTIATFEISEIDWSTPRVGNEDNNPDPSFLGQKITDMFFYKNRLGIASSDSITMTELANYTNYYVTTAVDIVATDIIDITVSTNQASNIYYAKPFNNSLYIFTKYAQYELTSETVFGPTTVSLENVTNYPMKVDVEPVVMNDSLYFVSESSNRQQLREYIKADNLTVKGVDLNIATPTYLAEPITKLLPDGVIGTIICGTASGTAYVYRYKDDGDQRVQSAWSTWTFFKTFPPLAFEWTVIGRAIGVIWKSSDYYVYHLMYLDDKGETNRQDTTVHPTLGNEIPDSYKASILLPDYYPQLQSTRTPLNKALIKRVVIEGTGQFDSDIYRKDYDVTYTKSHTLSMADKDLYVNSKVGNVDITIYDDSANDFTISSVVVESLFTPTSREMK